MDVFKTPDYLFSECTHAASKWALTTCQRINQSCRLGITLIVSINVAYFRGNQLAAKFPLRHCLQLSVKLYLAITPPFCQATLVSPSLSSTTLLSLSACCLHFPLTVVFAWWANKHGAWSPSAQLPWICKKKKRKKTEIQGHSRPSGGRVIAEGGVAAA